MPSRLATSLFVFAAILIPISPIAAVAVAAIGLALEIISFGLMASTPSITEDDLPK